MCVGSVMSLSICLCRPMYLLVFKLYFFFKAIHLEAVDPLKRANAKLNYKLNISPFLCSLFPATTTKYSQNVRFALKCTVGGLLRTP